MGPWWGKLAARKDIVELNMTKAIEIIGAPGMIRTCDTRIRNPVLYPLSYGGAIEVRKDVEHTAFFSDSQY